MNDNPYTPPQTRNLAIPDPALPGNITRKAALRRVRGAIAWIAVPGFVNVYVFSFGGPAGFLEPGIQNARDVFTLMYVINTLLSCVLVLILWFATVPMLEVVAKTLRRLFASEVPMPVWLEPLYTGTAPLRWAAPFGAALYIAWMGLIYSNLSLNTLILCNLFAVAGHLLGAAVYLPILWAWYRLRLNSYDRKEPEYET